MVFNELGTRVVQKLITALKNTEEFKIVWQAIDKIFVKIVVNSDAHHVILKFINFAPTVALEGLAGQLADKIEKLLGSSLTGNIYQKFMERCSEEQRVIF